ncbi:VWA domain-containing protein [Botrimarina hoheduenensis]|uniref:von Willebrand factor type A domain protein n=1 Tax=Botrimarina hoheduenensis TaxID=2528000 RepID=A0A5C5W9N8_9BACT|nr:VWA domain-containing protein [Botrimarina hoheduenensis]TWT47588.1 von Willebrand factor type A domain protein [Botrimarina hoheduenensis]
MLDSSLAFDSRWWLAALLLLPVLWGLSFGGLSGLGRGRRLAALVLRSLVFTAIVLALAEAQYTRTSDRLTVIYLLDQSASIPEAQREAMKSFVNASVRSHRRSEAGDRAGVIVFGRDATVELPPVDFTYEMPRIEAAIDRQQTNLAAAMQQAMSLFPPDSAKRIVIVSDGNENVGDGLREARVATASGVSIDVVPIPLPPRADTVVDKIAIPAGVRRGQPFEARVVIDHRTAAGDDTDGRGVLRIIRKRGDLQEIISESSVSLRPGKNAFGVRETIDQADFYTYEARFTPENPDTDASNQNNAATAYTHVRGKGHALVIEDWEHPDEFTRLVETLKDEGLDVTLRGSDRLFGSLADLQRYDTVILANTPRASGFGDTPGGVVSTDSISGFSDEQIAMLVRNTEELGCGLIMIGGDRSFGAGGWDETALEKALPVDLEIKAAKVTPVGALGMIMHASEIARGNYWQKRIAIEAIDALGPRDYAGLLTWNGSDQWLWGQSQGGMITVGPSRNQMKARLDRLTVGDMPQFDPAMNLAAQSFAGLNNPTPATKHLIIISDGDPSPPSARTMKSFISQGVKITTVAVGAHGPPGHATMQQIANQTGGKYYVVRNANALPRIYQREARRVSRPLVKELRPPIPPQMMLQHEIMQGIDPNLPAISGFVQTTVKDSSLVEVILRSPEPPNPESSTILATWNYGLGKVAAFTTDAGARWANDWTGWDGYAPFFSQMVRWSMRPTGDTGNFTLATEVEDGRARVILDALDKNEEFLELPAISGVAVQADGDRPLSFSQVAPGRYVAEFEADQAGSYILMVNPGPGQPMIRSGLSVGYSDEFRDRETNRPLLESIASLPAGNGEPGKVLSDEAGVEFDSAAAAEQVAAVDSYRRDLPPAVSRQPIWPLLVLGASVLFLADVFVRRVQIGFDWVARLWQAIRQRLGGGERPAAEPVTMQRLRSRKAALRDEQTGRQGATRFETPDEPLPASESPLAAATATPGAPRPKPRQSDDLSGVEKPIEEAYTSRLLKAKRKASQDRNEPPA